MKKYTISKILCLLFILVNFSIYSIAQCDSEIILDSQAAVDAFGANNCSSIIGDLTINGADIENLNALIGLQNISGSLFIEDNENLADISGLANVESISSNLYIINNDKLININAISKLTSIGTILWIEANENLLFIDGLSEELNVGGAIVIKDNPNFQYLDNLSSVNSANIDIRNNQSMYRINGLQGLTTVSGSVTILNNSALIDINGFSALKNIGAHLILQGNDSLKSFNGFSELANINGYANVFNNSNLENVDGLSGLNTIGQYLRIQHNNLLTDISGLENLTNLGDTLFIKNNSSLESCCVLSVLNENMDIASIEMSDNGIGCNSFGELDILCEEPSMGLNDQFIQINAYPSPTNSVLNIDLSNIQNSRFIFEIYDLNGKLILSKNHQSNSLKENISLDVSSFENGIYFLQVVSENRIVLNRKFVKD